MKSKALLLLLAVILLSCVTLILATDKDSNFEEAILKAVNDNEENGLKQQQEGESADIFEPTDEFQEVKEGQHIPAGLHVRMNMETGKVEAKRIPKPQKQKDEIEGQAQEQAVKEKEKEKEKENGSEKRGNKNNQESGLVVVIDEEQPLQDASDVKAKFKLEKERQRKLKEAEKAKANKESQNEVPKETEKTQKETEKAKQKEQKAAEKEKLKLKQKTEQKEENSIVVVEGASEEVNKDELKAKFKKNKSNKKSSTPKGEAGEEQQHHVEMCGMTKPEPGNMESSCGSELNNNEGKKEGKKSNNKKSKEVDDHSGFRERENGALMVVPDSEGSNENTDGDSLHTPMTKERLEELKEIWEVISQAVNSEPEALMKNIEILKNETSTDEQISAALEEMEGIVHLFDYGRDFVTMGGVPLVINLLKAETPEMRMKAAQVLGAAMQSNPGVQLYCYEDAGLLDVLLQLIEVEEDVLVKRRLLFVLSCLVRSYPGAQAANSKGFVSKLTSFYLKSTDLTFKKKCLTLVTDLVTEEKENATENAPLLNKFLKNKWCDHFLTDLASDDLDVLEKSIKGLEAFSPSCKKSKDYDKKLTMTLHRLKKLKQDNIKINNNDLSDGNTDYLDQLISLCQNEMSSSSL